MNKNEKLAGQRRHLYLALLALALPASEQLALFPEDPWIRRASELAHEAQTAIDRQRLQRFPDVAPIQVPELEELARKLDVISRDEALLSDEALADSGEWKEVRTLARGILDGGVWPGVAIRELESLFGPTANPSIFASIERRGDRED